MYCVNLLFIKQDIPVWKNFFPINSTYPTMILL